MILTMFERYTPSARQVIVFAQEEARGLRHNAIGSEHVLIGLLRDELGNGGRALRGLGLDAAAVQERVGAMLPPGSSSTAGQIPFTPRAQRILGRADAESLSLGHEGVGTEHLLLALARESDGIAMRVLGEHGIGPDALRDAVRRTLDEPVPDAVAERPAAAPPAAAGLRRAQPFASAPDHLSVPLAPDARRVLGRALAAALGDGRDELTADDLRAALSSD
jgi:ATP-dependent Clp protease ATP-binding subunit ClpA